MIYKSDLKICVCGHADFNHKGKICKAGVPDNNGITHTSNLTLKKCRCNSLDIAMDLSLDGNIHIKEFGSEY